ncbi:mitochondrial import receptor subunit TOM7 homolog [Toxorhynchites rutilus septentrionalis]|uniref:mitochondrial import receptor subunit TOM7 homolog n=1 Tax=Toxorhynchites rutilus septentrionalis TaxID=329112 RepID=UPI002479CB67|nr:mitochondrial import receptor subunit TOM7 homolog [Toxorhynchites rutilus septentrionalis]
MNLSPGAKERLGVVFEVVKTTFHWGFVPAVLYLGFRKGSEAGMPPLSVMSLLWQ